MSLVVLANYRDSSKRILFHASVDCAQLEDSYSKWLAPHDAADAISDHSCWFNIIDTTVLREDLRSLWDQLRKRDNTDDTATSFDMIRVEVAVQSNVSDKSTAIFDHPVHAFLLAARCPELWKLRCPASNSATLLLPVAAYTSSSTNSLPDFSISHAIGSVLCVLEYLYTGEMSLSTVLTAIEKNISPAEECSAEESLCRTLGNVIFFFLVCDDVNDFSFLRMLLCADPVHRVKTLVRNIHCYCSGGCSCSQPQDVVLCNIHAILWTQIRRVSLHLGAHIHILCM